MNYPDDSPSFLSFLPPMHDYNRQESGGSLFHFGQESNGGDGDETTVGGDGDDASAFIGESYGTMQQGQRIPESSEHNQSNFGLGLTSGDWHQFPSHMTFSFNGSATASTTANNGSDVSQAFSASDFRPVTFPRGRFNRQLHDQQQPRQHHHLSAASSAALAALGVPFAMFTSRPSQPRRPPQEIDLTVSSSDSEQEDSDYTFGNAVSGENDDDDDDGVQIVHTRRTNIGAAIGGIVNPSSRYLSYTSIPPLRRKRRRQETDADGDGAAAVRLTTEDPVIFDGQRAESTNISMENNETIERFKNALKCSICLDTIDEMTSTMCGHVYCGKCIRLAIRVTGKCPLCQRKLRPKDIHPLYF
uniref:RING-type domain-containing protein n=1 Tax=Globisporangium ultimum (strain ATCC 200006 / CBS 805.95 / DAOM BR144) TaxID=431595 RepID=K3W9U0_GLOUD